MSKRVISSALLVAGVVLVFAGLSAALGFTAGGMIASFAAVVMLLYAGAVWFGTTAAPAPGAGPADPVIVFDRALQIVCGASRGTALVAQFPEALRTEIHGRCAAALAGATGRFTCGYGGTEVAFDAVPVRGSDGSIVYGMLLSGATVSSGEAVSWSG